MMPGMMPGMMPNTMSGMGGSRPPRNYPLPREAKRAESFHLSELAAQWRMLLEILVFPSGTFLVFPVMQYRVREDWRLMETSI